MRQKSSPKLTIAMIVLNEEERLNATLSRLQFADELLVVDGGSSDTSCQIARSHGARLIKRRFDDFVRQKNFALEKARGEWVLVIDADEHVSPELAEELVAAIESVSDEVAFRLPRLTCYLGRWMRYSGWYPDYNYRLLRREACRFIGGTVHEEVEFTGRTGTIKNPLRHYSYPTISHHIRRLDHYSTLIAKDKFRRGHSSSPLWATLKSISKFLITYVWRLGFLDRGPGFVLAVLSAYYNYLKYIKLWELRHNQRCG